MSLLYPNDATTQQMILAHSQGLALFEALHKLLESCKALAQRQWDLMVLNPTAVAAGGLRDGTSPHDPPSVDGFNPLPRPASAGGPRATHRWDSACADRPRTSVDGARTSGEGTTDGSAMGGKIKRTFSWGKKSGSGGSNKVFPTVTGVIEESDPQATVSLVNESTAPAAIVGGSSVSEVRRHHGLHLSWAQFEVLERQRQLLVRLR